MAILPFVQSLWIGNALSMMERLCISSFLKNGHEFHLYVYNEVKGIPDGTIIKDANTILSVDKIFKYKQHDSYAGFSNIFRYKLLLEKGNIWTDTDVICLRPFDYQSEYVFANELVKKKKGSADQKKSKVASCVIKAPSDCEIMQYCYDTSASRDPQSLIWGEIGPDLLTHAVEKYSQQSSIVKPTDICPVNWWNYKRLVSDSLLVGVVEKLRLFYHHSHAIHLWNEMWRRNGIDKNGHVPPYSIYRQLGNRYLN